MKLLCVAPIILLSACSSTPDPAAVVPADLVRPPCRPGADLMAAPEPLPPIRAGEGARACNMAQPKRALRPPSSQT